MVHLYVYISSIDAAVASERKDSAVFFGAFLIAVHIMFHIFAGKFILPERGRAYETTK